MKVYVITFQKKKIRPSHKPAWYNKRLSNLKNKKNKSYKRYRTDFHNPVLKQTYIQHQREFDVLNAFLYNSYIHSTELSLQDNSKLFWVFLNSKRKSNGLPSFMHYNEIGSSNTTEICNLFADFFKSVYTSQSSPPSHFSNLKPIADISQIDITLSDVKEALLSLVPKTSVDDDGIANIILKNCLDTISWPLLVIFSIPCLLVYF